MPVPTWKTFLACLMAMPLDNLQEVFECSIITDFIWRVFGFSIAFVCWVITFDRFTDFVFFLQIRIIIFFSITRMFGFFL